jgi:hypothetical protein
MFYGRADNLDTPQVIFVGVLFVLSRPWQRRSPRFPALSFPILCAPDTAVSGPPDAPAAPKIDLHLREPERISGYFRPRQGQEHYRDFFPKAPFLIGILRPGAGKNGDNALYIPLLLFGYPSRHIPQLVRQGRGNLAPRQKNGTLFKKQCPAFVLYCYACPAPRHRL